MKVTDQVATNRRQTAFAVFAKSMFLLGICWFAVAGAQAQTFTVLHTFTGTGGDGATPFGGVVKDAGGNLYGVTLGGGSGYGTIYKLDPAGNQTVLHTFNLTDGSGPLGTLVSDSAGKFFGITAVGGAVSDGEVFKLDTTGGLPTLTTLYSTLQAARGGLARDAAGNLYGTEFIGGDYTNGVVFKLGIDVSGNPTVSTILHSFGSVSGDGVNPTSRLLVDAAGNVYGTTENGLGNACVVFKIDPSANYSILHAFTDTPDGAICEGGVIMDSAGNLYGATFHGGTYGLGTIYKIDSSNHETVLYSFSGAVTDGAKPSGALARDAAGNLYGVTMLGGANNLGTIFKLDPAGHLTVLHSFGTDANDPSSDMLLDNGVLYGTTTLGGAANLGAVYSLTIPVPVLTFNSFSAQVVASQALHATAAGGEFDPGTTTIDPTTQAVSLTVAGANSFSWTFPAGSFRKIAGLYVAAGTNIGMALTPLAHGKWAYTAALAHFLPGSPTATVTLSVGAESGTATVNVTTF